MSESMLRGHFEGKNRVVVTVKQPENDDALPVLAFEGVVDTDVGEPVGAGGGVSDAT